MVETRRRPFRYMGNDICRELVSSVPKNKRYQLNGHNLDLAYFQEYRLVVMAWPAETLCVRDIKRSKIIRNDAQEGKVFDKQIKFGQNKIIFLSKRNFS